mmetsp:Transcript_16694/g.47594  ORF Transcript_16694/g.47594 Transcript_16694/m.47594 type:complete len:300 (+) Transcript_16694:2473-3372(+)
MSVPRVWTQLLNADMFRVDCLPSSSSGRSISPSVLKSTVLKNGSKTSATESSMSMTSMSCSSLFESLMNISVTISRASSIWFSTMHRKFKTDVQHRDLLNSSCSANSRIVSAASSWMCFSLSAFSLSCALPSFSSSSSSCSSGRVMTSRYVMKSILARAALAFSKWKNVRAISIPLRRHSGGSCFFSAYFTDCMMSSLHRPMSYSGCFSSRVFCILAHSSLNCARSSRSHASWTCLANSLAFSETAVGSSCDAWAPMFTRTSFPKQRYKTSVRGCQCTGPQQTSPVTPLPHPLLGSTHI